MRTLIVSIVELAAILACAAARADDVYRWVDANGVTNYSSAPPAQMKTGTRFDVVAPRVSIYTPDAGAQRTATATEAHADRVRDERIKNLEQARDAELQARQYAAAAAARAAQLAHEQCVAQRYVDCDAYGANPPYPLLVIGVAGRRARAAGPATVPTLPLTGVTAGNVTDAIGMGGGAVNRTPGASGSRLTPLRGDPPQTGKRSTSQ